MARARLDASRLAPAVLLLACSAGAPRVQPDAGRPSGAAGGSADAGPPHDATAAGGSSGSPAIADGPTPEPPPPAAPDAPTPVEAGAPDAPPEAGAAGCPGLFCEDFESGALDPGKWAVTSGVNHVDDATPPPVVTSDRAAHGKYAAHFHGKGNVPNDDAFIVTKALPAELRTHHFGRLYFYVATKPTSGHTQWILGGSAAMSANPKLRDFEVATINGGWQLGFDQLGMTPSGEEVFYPTGQVPVAKWTCLEWELDDQPDSDTAWIEGASLGTLDDQHINYPAGHVPGAPIFDGKSSGLIGGFTTYSFGFYDWHPNADFDLYFDDIVLDTKRVGCL
ncbi:MAG TPA: hypothetical protein VHL80_11260 [Polyangia bacterium]|nr:hypothetical protein [Polyangia bacterium]